MVQIKYQISKGVSNATILNDMALCTPSDPRILKTIGEIVEQFTNQRIHFTIQGWLASPASHRNKLDPVIFFLNISCETEFLIKKEFLPIQCVWFSFFWSLFRLSIYAQHFKASLFCCCYNFTYIHFQQISQSKRIQQGRRRIFFKINQALSGSILLSQTCQK